MKKYQFLIIYYEKPVLQNYAYIYIYIYMKLCRDLKKFIIISFNEIIMVKYYVKREIKDTLKKYYFN